MLPSGNDFFDALPEWVRRRLRPQLNLIETEAGALLGDSRSAEDIHFPINCVIAVVAKPVCAEQTFLRFIGSRSAIGVSSFLRTRDVHYEARVVGRGYSFVLPATSLFELMGKTEGVTSARCDAMSTLAEIAMVNGACSASHSVTQRLARLLLEAEDSFGVGMPITLTQLGLGKLIGVRRESVAALLNDWTAERLIETSRGKLLIRDREAIASLSCSCYDAAKMVDAHSLDRWQCIPWDERFNRPKDYAA